MGDLPRLTAEMRLALVECVKRWWQVLAELQPKEWATWDYHPWLDRRGHGVPYSAPKWFGGDRGVLPDRVRVRYLRAVYELDALGLVVCVKTGPRLTHVMPTEAGEQLAVRVDVDGMLTDRPEPVPGPVGEGARAALSDR